jgi:hypothetical protein
MSFATHNLDNNPIVAGGVWILHFEYLQTVNDTESPVDLLTSLVSFKIRWDNGVEWTPPNIHVAINAVTAGIKITICDEDTANLKPATGRYFVTLINGAGVPTPLLIGRIRVI